jgi:hypothetical protein
MAQPAAAKRRASFPSSDSANVLSNVDKRHPLKPPRVAWVKHGKYIALGGAGTAYFEIVERIKWSLASENWVRWVARFGVLLHGLTVVSLLDRYIGADCSTIGKEISLERTDASIGHFPISRSIPALDSRLYP